VLATDARDNTVTVGARDELLADRVAVRDLTLHRHAASVDAVRMRAHGRRLRCRLAQDLCAGRHGRARLTLEQPAERTAPGQLACLYSGELVVGHATVSA
jgi:tRNA-uridine 2-sulfurtransferase